jgi:Trans-aconitate methyltransferase
MVASDLEYAARIERLFYSHTDEKRIVAKLLDTVLGRRRHANGLDVGPGPGHITHLLSKRVSRLTLVEINHCYEDTLRSRYPTADLFIGSICDHKLDANSQDLILFSHVLYYIPESHWLSLSTRLYDALTPGGRLVIVVNDDRGDWWDILERFREPLGKYYSFSYQRPSRLCDELGAMTRIEVHRYPYHVVLPSLAAGIEFVGRQMLQIDNDEEFNRYHPAFKQVAQAHLHNERVVLVFNAIVVIVHRSQP